MTSSQQAAHTIIRLCRSGLDSVALRQEVSRALRAAVPGDAWCIATVDPATLLVTGGVSEGLPLSELARIAELEYFSDDVNKFSQLARSACPVGILRDATDGEPERSRRYRELLVPLGFAEELRAAFVVDGLCWGTLGLFRARGRPPFGAADAAFVAGVAPHIAEGLRVALLLAAPPAARDDTGPGFLLLDEDWATVTATPAAERWLAALPNAADARAAGRLPDVVYTVAAQVRGAGAGGEVPDEAPARARVQTRSGDWLVLHGTRLTGDGAGAARTAVIIEEARPPQLAPLIIEAYRLSARERDVLQLVLRGLGSHDLAAALGIAPVTVQDHLKAIFAKVGVRSRRELVAKFLADQYFPRVAAGAVPGPNGWFADAPARADGGRS